MASTIKVLHVMNNEIALKCFDDLIFQRKLPEDGDFEITEELMESFTELYHHNSGKEYSKYTILYRRDAGKSFLNLKISRGLKPKEIKEGFVYLISNPAWPDYTKIGISVNINKRLSTYQTGDPFRRYKIEGYEFLSNRKEIEKKILSKFNVIDGEWVETCKSKSMISYIREEILFSTKVMYHRDNRNKKIFVGDIVAYNANGYKFGIISEICEKSIKIDEGTRSIHMPPKSCVSIPYRNPSKNYIKNVLRNLLT